MKTPTIPLQLLLLASFLGSHPLEAAENQNRAQRGDSLQALCQRLEIGPGATVADVGCGDGPDTMVFAAIVGERGTVLAQEIDPAKLKKVAEIAGQKGFHQVVPVLGQGDDPRLPDGLADLVYMNRVFHHFARPQAMLERLWMDLKPGGYLVIVDQQKGPLTDWTPLDQRAKEHHWTGETTVVRLAREAGFLFHDVLDELWYEKPPFVLTFRKPQAPRSSRVDPDLPQPIDAQAVINALPTQQIHSAVAFCGLDRGRAVLPVLQEKLPASVRCFDIVMDEWALSREELPPDGTPSGVEVLRTEKGKVTVPAEIQLELVLFVDAYHRLWDPQPLLAGLKNRLAESALLAVIDREGPDTESRRLAGHRRHIASKRVIEEMRQAGFHLRQTLPAPAQDRFFLLFGF